MILDLIQTLNELTWPGALGLFALAIVAWAIIKEWSEWLRS